MGRTGPIGGIRDLAALYVCCTNEATLSISWCGSKGWLVFLLGPGLRFVVYWTSGRADYVGDDLFGEVESAYTASNTVKGRDKGVVTHARSVVVKGCAASNLSLLPLDTVREHHHKGAAEDGAERKQKLPYQ